MRNPFRSDDEETETEPEPQTDAEPEPEPEPTPEPEYVTLVEEGTHTFEYTEHEGTAHFSDGSSRDFTFDCMSREEHAIILSNYVGELQSRCGSRRELGPEGQEKFVTIERRNLNFFETTERTQKEMTKDYRNEHYVERHVAERHIDSDEYYIKEDRDDNQ